MIDRRFDFRIARLSIRQEETASAVLGAKQVSSTEKYKAVISVKLINSYILRKNGLRRP